MGLCVFRRKQEIGILGRLHYGLTVVQFVVHLLELLVDEGGEEEVGDAGEQGDAKVHGDLEIDKNEEKHLKRKIATESSPRLPVDAQVAEKERQQDY